jgi:lipoprotein-anchoring transpeptidase ErfK/SrfK
MRAEGRSLAALLLLALLLTPVVARADDWKGVWLLVDTVARRLDVYSDYTPVARFYDISIGSGGTAWLRREGEGTTPLGEFRINRINRESRFRIFLGLDYPNLRHAQRARAAGLLDDQDYLDYLAASVALGYPPQNTGLGGHIGIHGLGAADPEIHRQYNWTNGCIALTNEQVEQLAKWVKIGTPVLIR